MTKSAQIGIIGIIIVAAGVIFFGVPILPGLLLLIGFAVIIVVKKSFTLKNVLLFLVIYSVTTGCEPVFKSQRDVHAYQMTFLYHFTTKCDVRQVLADTDVPSSNFQKASWPGYDNAVQIWLHKPQLIRAPANALNMKVDLDYPYYWVAPGKTSARPVQDFIVFYPENC